MSDSKMLFGVIAAFGILAAGFWFGWFGPISKSFQGIKKNAVTSGR